jgi:hypothetical protein
VLLVLASGTVAQARASELHTTVGLHISLADVGEEWGAGGDLTLAAAWVVIPELAIGLEAAALLPLHTGDDPRQTDVALRANPAVWLRMGEPTFWSYLKLGCGVDSHLRGGALEPVMVLLGAVGFAVAPPELNVHFGFEISGEVDILGDITTRTLGLGGFLGFRFW